MKINNIIFYFTFISFSISYGQTRLSSKQYDFYKTIPQENIYVHNSSNFLLSGEILYYKIYCSTDSNGKLSNLSKVAYVEIVTRDKKVIFNQKVILNEGVGQGDFFIPSNLPSDSYKLIVYTQWMKNKNNFYQDDLFIVNPFNRKISMSSSKKRYVYDKEGTKKNEKIFDISKTIFSPREKVILNITSKENDLVEGNYSVSVKMKNPTFHLKNEYSKRVKKNESKTTNSRIVFLPELKGELIHGRIISNNEDNKLPTRNINITLSIPQKGGISKMTSTNASGQFYFSLNENYTGGTAYIEVLDEGDYRIELVKNTSIQYDQLVFPRFSLDSTSLGTISKRTTYTQIENLYSSKKNDTIQELAPYTPRILRNIKLAYNLDDYVRFNTLKETFVEVILHAWIDKKGDQYSFMAKLPENEFIDPKALLIIDGYIVKDHNSVIDYNPRKIKRISILKETYQLNSKFFEGVIYMETKKGDYTPTEKNGMIRFNLTKPSELKRYFSPNYENQNLKRIPDYRTQLLWLPNLHSKSKEVTFYTSDVKGGFEIVLEGYDKTGKYVYSKKVIKVK